MFIDGSGRDARGPLGVLDEIFSFGSGHFAGGKTPGGRSTTMIVQSENSSIINSPTSTISRRQKPRRENNRIGSTRSSSIMLLSLMTQRARGPFGVVFRNIHLHFAKGYSARIK